MTRCSCYPGCPENGLRVYLAGPMTGIEDFNFPAFHAAAADLRAAGFAVVNPAENDGGDTSRDWEHYMRQDIKHVADCDAIALLPDWEQSRGVKLELTVARALGMPIYPAAALAKSGTATPAHQGTANVLQKADELVSGRRGSDYGHPYDDFSRTAALWNALLGDKLREPLDANDVPAMMRMVKESRLRNSPRHRDSLVDIGGYARTQEMVWERDA